MDWACFKNHPAYIMIESNKIITKFQNTSRLFYKSVNNPKGV